MLLLLCMVAQAPEEGDPLDPEPEFKIDYEEKVVLVDLPLRIVRDGRPVTELKLADLTVQENGVPAQVRDLKKVQTPLKMHILMDLSTSNADNIFQIKAATRFLIKKMRKGDTAKLSYFSNTYQELTEYHDNRDFLIQKLTRVTPLGSTALYDGINAALEDMRQHEGPKALFLFSDGHDLMSHTKEVDLELKVKNYGIPIYMISYEAANAKLPPLLAQQTQFMTTLIGLSGGHLFRGDREFQGDLNTALKRARTRFLVNYISPNAGAGKSWRSIMATVNGCNNCTLIYRRGYEM
nr:VWA domain-containing protein [Acanthopleuribacter pedis]